MQQRRTCNFGLFYTVNNCYNFNLLLPLGTQPTLITETYWETYRDYPLKAGTKKNCKIDLPPDTTSGYPQKDPKIVKLTILPACTRGRKKIPVPDKIEKIPI